jgi:DNA-directed RNA polymerase specialized sigma24 family protein
MTGTEPEDISANPPDAPPTVQADQRRQPRFGTLTKEDASLLARLSDRDQTILRQSGNMKEISERLNVPLGTVKSRLHRARVALAVLRSEEAHLKDTNAPAS